MNQTGNAGQTVWPRTTAPAPERDEDVIANHLFDDLHDLIQGFKAGKPTERCERARCYAVTITELEKALAYFSMYVVNGE